MPACWHPLTFLHGRRCVHRVTDLIVPRTSRKTCFCRTPCLESAVDRLETLAFDCFIQEQTEEFSVSCCLPREHCVNSGMRHRSDCTTSHCYCYCGADAKSGLIGRVMTGRVFGIRSLGHSLSGHFQCACWQWTRGQDQHGVVLWKVPPEATWKSRTANCSGASSATLSWRKGSKMNFLLFCLWPCFSSSCLSFKYYCCVKVQARVLLVVRVLKVVGKPMIWWWCVQWRKWLEIFMLHCCVATKLHVHMSFSCFYCRLTNNVGFL